MKTQDALDQITYLQELINQTRLRGGGWLSLFSPLGSPLDHGVYGVDPLVRSGVAWNSRGRQPCFCSDRLQDEEKPSRAPASEEDRLGNAGFIRLYGVFIRPVAARHG